MKNILLIGLGRFGIHVAENMHNLGHQVMGIDISEKKVNDALQYLANAQIGDSTDSVFLSTLGIKNFDVCFVAIGEDFQSSLETTSLLKDLGASFVVSLASNDIHSKFLLRNGADEVVYPEKQVAKWASIRYSDDSILEYIELDDNNSIYEVTVPNEWLGLTVGQLDIRKKYRINIIGTKMSGNVNFLVTPETLMTADKTLLVLGDYKALKKCFNI